MNRILLLLSVTIFSGISYAQSSTDKLIYLDSVRKETTKDNSKYYRIIKEYSSTRDSYEVIDFYNSGKIQMTGKVSDKEYLTRFGEFLYYNEDGTKIWATHYEKSIPIGKHEEWYANGNKKLEGEYLKNEKHKNFQGDLKIENYWHNDGKQLVINGEGYYYQSNISHKCEGKIKNGMKDGVWTGENQFPAFTFTENYEKGNLISGVSTDSQNNTHEYDEVFTAPKPRKGINHFYKYISKEMNIPKEAENISGKMLLTFVIEYDGSVNELNVLKSLGELLDNEGIRIIKSYPDWKSGFSRGIPTKFLYSIPINVVAAN